MSICAAKEGVENFAIGILLAVILMGIGWGAVMLIYATNSNGFQTYVLNHADQRMMGRSVLRVAGSADLPADQ